MVVERWVLGKAGDKQGRPAKEAKNERMRERERERIRTFIYLSASTVLRRESDSAALCDEICVLFHRHLPVLVVFREKHSRSFRSRRAQNIQTNHTPTRETDCAQSEWLRAATPFIGTASQQLHTLRIIYTDYSSALLATHNTAADI